MNMQIDTEIGTIAANWKLVELGSVCEKPQYGFTASSASNGSAKFLRITDIDDFGVNWDEVPFCDCTAEEFNKYRLYSDDIVFARIGATTGKSYLIKNPPKAVFASYLIRVRPKPEIDPEFLIHFFQSDAYWRQVNANKNSNLKKGVNGSVLNTLLIPQPPLPEQRRIAHVLTIVQNAIAQQERFIALIGELKRALMRKLFTEGVPRLNRSQRPVKSVETEIGLVPEGWEVVELGEFDIEIQNGFPCGTWNEEGRGIVQLRPFNVTNDGMISLSKKKFIETDKNYKKYLVRLGDVIFNNTNSEELVGRAAFWNFGESRQDIVLSNHMTILRVNDDKLQPEFLSIYLQKRWVDGYAHSVCQRHVNQASIGTDKINKYLIPLPRLDEQKEICNTFNALDNKTILAQRKKALLEELFRTLLHQLMTGQTRVDDIGGEDFKRDRDLTGL
jgi:type I restriction enzyme S subunit